MSLMERAALPEKRRRYSGAVCPVCSHPMRARIDQQLKTGTSLSAVSREIEDVSIGALKKHRDGHLRVAQDAVSVIAAAASRWVPEVDAMFGEAKRRLNALGEDDHKAFAKLIPAFTSLATLAAKLEGDLKTGSQINILNLKWQQFGVKSEEEARTIIQAHQGSMKMNRTERATLMVKALVRYRDEDPDEAEGLLAPLLRRAVEPR